MKREYLGKFITSALACAVVFGVTTAHAQVAPKMKMSTDIPAFVTTPNA